jgi:hypothetical protein
MHFVKKAPNSQDGVDFNMIMNLRYGGITKIDADGLKFRISYILLLNSITV